MQINAKYDLMKRHWHANRSLINESKHGHKHGQLVLGQVLGLSQGRVPIQQATVTTTEPCSYS